MKSWIRHLCVNVTIQTLSRVNGMCGTGTSSFKRSRSLDWIKFEWHPYKADNCSTTDSQFKHRVGDDPHGFCQSFWVFKIQKIPADSQSYRSLPGVLCLSHSFYQAPSSRDIMEPETYFRKWRFIIRKMVNQHYSINAITVC